MELKIEYVPITDIKPYERNAKLHPEEQIEQIRKSIESFGMDDPIGIWHDEVVEGHGRLEACKRLGYTNVHVVRLDHLTDEQRKAYALAHNKLTMNSGFDVSLLAAELDDLAGEIDMSEYGFDIAELADEIDKEAETRTEETFNYKEQYAVIVMCKDENEQEATYNRLLGEGFECKVVSV